MEITLEQLLQFLGEECAKVKILERESERLRQQLEGTDDEPDTDSDDGKP